MAKAARAAVPYKDVSEAALRAKAEELWELEQRLTRAMDEVKEEKGVLERKDAELCDIGEHMMAFNNQLNTDRLALKNERETLTDLYDKLAERETRVAAIAAMNGGQRWPGAPDGLAGILIYLADMLSNAYQVAGWTLRENCHERFERLNPGDLKYSLEVLYQLLRARKMIEDLNERVIEDYRARHPRLAAEEMDAYEAARKAAAADKSKLPPGGAAGLMGLPVDSRLSDGFAIPIRVLLGTSRDFVRERGLLGTLDGTKEGVVLALSRPQTLVVSGQPGSGKTHVLLVIIEMLIQALRNISTLEKRAQVVWFHLGLSANDYPADLGPAQRPNSGPESVAALHALGGVPQGLPGRRVVFVPPGQPVEALQQRQREYPGAEIRIIRLGQKDRFPGYLRVLLGVEEKGGKQFVTLRNPWGQREPGRDGRDDGIFTMPLDQFLTSFATVEFAKL